MRKEAAVTGIATYLLHDLWGWSWWWAVPLFIALFIGRQAYRMFIYERFLSPLAKLPGPKGHWFYGEFKKILKDEPGMAHLQWMREYRNPTGLISYPGIFYQRRLFPVSGNALQHILNNWTLYVRPEESRVALRRILGDGLLTAEGDMHKRQRKVLTPAFATGHIRASVEVFAEKAENMVNAFYNAVKDQTEEGIEVFKYLSRTTLDIIGKAGFGYDFDSLNNPDDPFAAAYGDIFNVTPGAKVYQVFLQFIPWIRHLPFQRALVVKAARKSIVEHATKLVRDKEGHPGEGTDILSLMIAQNETAVAEGQLAEMELVDQVMTFLLAGHETTSTAVSWGLYILSQHQDIQDRLRAEVAHLTNPTFEDLEHARYLNNVCKEILRFIPPVSVTSRVASQDDVINGVKIPKGTIVFIAIAAINFDETIWGPDVDTFNPDRWDKLPETVTNYAYMTFLQGPRNCIGRRFAETEMKLLLAYLIQNFKFDEVIKGRVVEKQSLITTRPKGGMHLKMSPV